VPNLFWHLFDGSFRAQDEKSSLDALLEALSNLDDLFSAIDGAYKQSYHWNRFERFSEAEDGDVPAPPSTLGS
jgi:hypothetical protein